MLRNNHLSIDGRCDERRCKRASIVFRVRVRRRRCRLSFRLGDALLESSVRFHTIKVVCEQQCTTDSSCLHVMDFPDRENCVQVISASHLMYYKLILNLPVDFLILFCGAWRDCIGRRMQAMLSSFGTIVAFAILYRAQNYFNILEIKSQLSK